MKMKKTSKRRIEDEEDSKDKMDEDNSQDSDEDPEASSGEKKVNIKVESPIPIAATELPITERKISQLQYIICECINDNGGSCHFDLIVHHVSKSWNRDSPSDLCRSATLSTLTGFKWLFKRDTKRTGWWIINGDVDITSLKGVKNDNTDSDLVSSSPAQTSQSSRSSRYKSRQSKVIISADADDSQEQNTSNNENNDEDPNSDDEDDEQSKTKEGREPPMTELQILIIEAIDTKSGSATFEEIYDHVQRSFDNLKRRDGTPYTSDCRRAIQASLSNNPATKPFFKKDTTKATTSWTLAKRSDYRASKVVEKEKAEINGEIEEEEEEIKDDEPAESMDGEEDDKEEKQEVKEKYLFANRVKRARKLKEQAGRRQLRDSTMNGATELYTQRFASKKKKKNIV